jgi:hypothetical protein
LGTLTEEFAQFYTRYPRKMARLDAEKAYLQIRRRDISHERIMAGLERYLEHLPEDVCFIPYPATWIRAGRFDDEYEVLVERRSVPRPDWFAECKVLHNGECGLSQLRHHNRKLNEKQREQAS